MGWQSWTVWVVWCAILTWVLQNGECAPPPAYYKPKLLYIMMDGFRWDYIDKQSESALPGFTKFLNKGVRARWTNPVFPSLSFPSWTSLFTGQYVETHNLVGNYFYDAETKEVFSLSDLETTKKPKWWTSEPIWTTAEKAGLVTAQYQWARCDVPIDGITTHFCKPYRDAMGKELFHEYIMNALQKFNDGYDFVQVYTEHTDIIGHTKGPDSEEVKQAVRDMDDVIDILITELEDRQLTNHVNIVIVSDHGMANTAPDVTQRHEIDNYLDASLVENIADNNVPLMNIKVPKENIQKVYDQLSRIPGATVYKKEDIPEHLHYKNGKYVHEIVVVADEGNLLMGSNSAKQFPPKGDYIIMGHHGYKPDVQSMKGIFLAKGPAFREGVDIDPIHMVDVYQVLTHVLELTPQPHNGTWENVKQAFKNPEQDNGASTILISFILVFLFLTLLKFLHSGSIALGH